MDKFARILLAAMGWSNTHLHAFAVGNERYGMNYDDFPEGEIDEKSVTVLQALRDERRFIFEYDFGDSWDHEVVVEELTRPPIGLKFAVCIDGANACRRMMSAAPGATPSFWRQSLTPPTTSMPTTSNGSAGPSI